MTRLRTQIPGPRSLDLAARRKGAVAAGVGSTLPVYVERAEDGLLVDVDGNRLIDLASGIAVTGVGNPAPRVAAAVHEQIDRFSHTCFMVTPYEGYVEVCERLNALTPGTHEKRSVLFNSGAEAVENAVKIARHATGRTSVVVFDHAYHGRTNLTMALTAKNMPYKQGFGPFAPEVYRAPMSYPYRDGLTGPEAAARAIDVIEKQVGVPACVLIEPIQGEGGFIEPAPGFLAALADWCRERGALLVADEIQTGFCRTGAWFAAEHQDVVPDLVTTAKGIAGGLPLAAVTGRAEVMDAVHSGGLGGTYGGNPIACAAALGAIDTMAELDLNAAARRIEATVLPRLRAAVGRHGDVRGRGAMLAVEFADRTPEVAARVAGACHAAGVVVLTCGTHGNVIRLLPPLVIPDGVLDEGVAVLEQAIVEGVGR
ncbi:4-aminobutyrate--2-oxoglutarate transaminase [Actinosynnema sp. NPDC047251]|uniref:(S)-3-amino-2-methylpropionate transaminase n=1 Tax=Saccharothrix espanaensis (strain ATCC 51144 / DSM 44229 / JCM 9112 / NBRC 15066 / NRRL 15764) TaxID=1179773 RepID=K0K999_SACES|nr:4-aminobutyrate--2-oxoglutarate transaminase [Saccharothrix espanaensis]CCH33414.1 4-aminobutyrate aminotransferase, PLP-dependent [Saccharothrix espanaensis DSM 44229]